MISHFSNRGFSYIYQGFDVNSMLFVALGGAVGSVFRYQVGVWAARWLGPAFPWGTLTVNIVGSLAIGFLSEMILRRFGGSDELRLLLVTGLLGGFTTFSAFSLDFVLMIQRGALGPAFLYLIASVAVSVAAVFIGIFLGRAAF